MIVLVILKKDYYSKSGKICLKHNPAFLKRFFLAANGNMPGNKPKCEKTVKAKIQRNFKIISKMLHTMLMQFII